MGVPLPVNQSRIFDLEEQIKESLLGYMEGLDLDDEDEFEELSDLMYAQLLRGEDKETFVKEIREFFPIYAEDVSDFLWSELTKIDSEPEEEPEEQQPEAEQPIVEEEEAAEKKMEEEEKEEEVRPEVVKEEEEKKTTPLAAEKEQPEQKKPEQNVKPKPEPKQEPRQHHHHHAQPMVIPPPPPPPPQPVVVNKLPKVQPRGGFIPPEAVQSQAATAPPQSEVNVAFSRDLTERTGFHMTEAGDNVLLQKVDPGTAAWRCGMQHHVGKQLVKVNGTPVRSIRECLVFSHTPNLVFTFTKHCQVQETGKKAELQEQLKMMLELKKPPGMTEDARKQLTKEQLDTDIEKIKAELMGKREKRERREKEKKVKKEAKKEVKPTEDTTNKRTRVDEPDPRKKSKREDEKKAQEELLKLMLQREKTEIELKEKEKEDEKVKKTKRESLINALNFQQKRQLDGKIELQGAQLKAQVQDPSRMAQAALMQNLLRNVHRPQPLPLQPYPNQYPNQFLQPSLGGGLVHPPPLGRGAPQPQQQSLLAALAQMQHSRGFAR